MANISGEEILDRFNLSDEIPVLDDSERALVLDYMKSNGFKTVFGICEQETPGSPSSKSRLLAIDLDSRKYLGQENALVGPNILGDFYTPAGLAIWVQSQE